MSLQGLIHPKPGDPSSIKLVHEPEVVLTAIKTALELAGQEHDPDFELKFHPDSGMLIVRASPRQLNAAKQATRKTCQILAAVGEGTQASGRKAIATYGHRGNTRAGSCSPTSFCCSARLGSSW